MNRKNHLPAVITALLLVGLLSQNNASAKDEPPIPAPEEQFVTMPESYYQAREQAARAAHYKKGDVKQTPGYLPGYRHQQGLGLSPLAPLATPVATGLTAPPFGSLLNSKKIRFAFHGYLQPTLRIGFGPKDDDQGHALHADPVVPGGAYGWLDHTGTLPTPWAHLSFQMGNKVVKGTAILGAWSSSVADDASGYHMANAQTLFSDVYLTYTPKVLPVYLKINAGVFPDRYGFMEKWRQGAYGTSLIGDIYGMGVTTTLTLPFVGDFDVIVEGGFKGEADKVPIGTPQSGANEYADDAQGATFAGHAHLGVFFGERYTITGHLIYSFSADDRKDLPDLSYTPTNEAKQRKDGHLLVAGGDLRVDGKKGGYLYAGGAFIDGVHTNALTDLVRVLNTGGGKDLNEHFWGFDSDGTGRLLVGGLQYTLSLGTLLRDPIPYYGVGPDLTISVFSIFARRQSEVVGKSTTLKYGAEALYRFFPVAAAALRIDHVMPDVTDQHQSFGVISPRLVFYSDWNARESLTIQYSYYRTGAHTVVRGDNRLLNTNSQKPDRHMVALYGTIWW